MAFDLNIKNIGKLSDAKIRIGQFTVLAGPNNTGKSFVSKLLYSIFDAINANHAEVYINTLTEPIRDELNRLEIWEESEDNSPVNALSEEVKKLENLVKKFPIGNFTELDKIIPDLANRAENMQTMFPDMRAFISSAPEKFDSLFESSLGERVLNRLGESLKQLQVALSGTGAGKIIVSGIAYKVEENLIQNFQVPNLSDLKGREKHESVVSIDDIGEFRFSNDDFYFYVAHDGLQRLQEYSKVIYLESPVYWKLKNALESVRMHPRYLYSRREQLNGIPGYFYDLASALNHEYTGEVDFPELYKKLTGKEVIDGKIAISESGDLSFQENDRNFSLPVTAMGVANLGMLALLIERKVLDKDSFLFIDEPEAHLHPAWQVVMADALFELAKGGVNVVIATHSADILKWLEVHVKKHPSDESLIALNKFPANGDEPENQDFEDKIAAIKQELTKPFADLYMAGL